MRITDSWKYLAPAALALFLFTGCAGYRLGTTLPADIQTVHVPIIKNNTDEPAVESTITQAILVELQKDGALKVVREELADAILDVELNGYELSPVGFRGSGSPTTANEYRIQLTAAIVLTRRATGEVVAESPRVRGDSTFPFRSDLTTAKRQNLPEAADDLAQKIVSQVVEAW